MNELFTQALPVLKEIERHGFEAYFVGGCVRDFYLNRDINDIDIAVSATPEEIKKIFNRTVDIGIEHGTVLVLHERGQFEMTTFRTEGTYSDSRRPDEVKFVRSLEEDLKRRDFTMNAMALSSTYTLTDLFGGREDMNKNEIRTVGAPGDRFEEDALRMLRAVRFVSQLNFSIEKKTYEAIQTLAPRLSFVAVERITAEFEKLIGGPAADRALTYAVETGLADFMPPLINQKVVNTMSRMNWHTLTADERLVLLLLIGQNQDLKEILKQWRMSNKTIKKCELLAGLVAIRHERSFEKTDIYYSGFNQVRSAEKIATVLMGKLFDERWLEDLYHAMQIKSKQDLAFKGTHLIKWAEKKGGPWVKECTAEIEKHILNGMLNNHLSDIKDWVETEWLRK